MALCSSEEENDLKHSDPPDYRPSAKTDEISTGPELSENKKQELEDLVRKLQPDAGEASHRIITNNAVPVRLHAYRSPNAYEQKFRKELQYLLDYKLIEPSTSPAAPMFAVPKRGSEDLRLVVNYKTTK